MAAIVERRRAVRRGEPVQRRVERVGGDGVDLLARQPVERRKRDPLAGRRAQAEAGGRAGPERAVARRMQRVDIAADQGVVGAEVSPARQIAVAGGWSGGVLLGRSRFEVRRAEQCRQQHEQECHSAQAAPMPVLDEPWVTMRWGHGMSYLSQDYEMGIV